jgi:hypothetical protein
MSLEESRGISFFFNHSATEKAMDDILFDEYESELNRLFEDEVIKEQNNDNVS